MKVFLINPRIKYVNIIIGIQKYPIYYKVKLTMPGSLQKIIRYAKKKQTEKNK